MNVEVFRDYCLAKKGVTESFPFDENTLVFKVMEKMFAFTGLEHENLVVHLKCDPEYSLSLREEYAAVRAGMNKKHWNRVGFEEDVPDDLLAHLIDHSYELVVQKLRKADREILNQL